MVKNPPAIQERLVQSLGKKNPLEKKMATHSSILTWKIPWTEESGGLQSMGLQRVKHNYTTEHNNEFMANLYRFKVLWLIGITVQK